MTVDSRNCVLDKRNRSCDIYCMKTKAPKDEFDADELNLISLAQEYSDEDKAQRACWSGMRWPQNGKPSVPALQE